MAPLVQWLKDRLSRRRNEKHPPPRRDPEAMPMPYLPAHRPRALSLPSSTVQTCAFFAKLPPELRQEIYDLAFCNRTIHIDLRYGQAYKKGTGYANLTPDEWQWWGSICHRSRKPIDGEKLMGDFWHDNCRVGEGTYRRDEGLDSTDYFVGVMGWLQTCRQAYSETIARLYEKNTFFFGHSSLRVDELVGGFLLRHIGGLLLPQRLASIGRLEVVMNSRGLSGFGTPMFPWHLDNIIKHFPNLRSLQLALIMWSFGHDDGAGNERDIILNPLDGFARHYGEQLELLKFAIDGEYYDRMFEALRSDGVVQMKDQSTGLWKFYKLVDPAASLGYWVINRQWDQVVGG